jgi:dipeptidase E
MKNKILIFLSIFLFLGVASFSSAHLPRIIYDQGGDIKVERPEYSQAFYDELVDSPRNYLINSEKEFTLYINLLVPAINGNSRYSANIYLIKNDIEEKIAFVDGQTDFLWQDYYEEFDRDYYRKGPEFEKILQPGNYKIEIFSYTNKGKYVLALGKNEVFPILESIKIFWTLPMLKMQFFKTSVLEFLFTPFGFVLIGAISAVLLLIAFFSFISFFIDKIKDIKPMMLLLTSSGMQGSSDDIMAILPKPADAIRIAHIITASKPEEDKHYVEKDVRLMKEAGFNVHDIDIDGKNPEQLLHLLSDFDIIYMQGGNPYYLLDKIRRSGFKKVLKKLLKKGIIYVGVSAGSMVAGANIEAGNWENKEIDKFGLTNLNAMSFIPYSIFVHYASEHQEIIKKQSSKVKNQLKILTDSQALFILNKKITLVGSGEAIIAKDFKDEFRKKRFWFF